MEGIPRIVKKIGKGAGSTLALAGVILVVLTLRDYADSVDFTAIGSPELVLLVTCVAAYAIGQILLGRAWHCLLGHQGLDACPYWAVEVYGVTQIAKYVPGSVFHFAGRQAMGMAKGYNGPSLLRSTLWEQCMQCFAGMFFILMLLPMLITHPLAPLGSFLLFGLAILGTIGGLRVCFDQYVATAFCCDLIFLGISALLFIVVLEMCAGGDLPLDRSVIAGAFVAAWLTGVIVPGAPAGAGVREMSLLFLLGGPLPEAQVLMAAMLSRAVTVGGDMGFYAIAVSMPLGRKLHLIPDAG